MKCRAFASALGITAAALAAGGVHAEMSAEELAKLAQNPVGNLISLPFQNNTNLNFGPEKGTQNILNIQPVIPIAINKDWNIITRTIVPVISMPSLGPGDQQHQRHRRHRVHGVPVAGQSRRVDLGRRSGGPAADEQQRGARQQELGAGAVGRRAAPGARHPWVYGVLVNNVWSLTSDKHGGSYNNGLIQPFLNYNFEDGLYLTSSPILTVNWKAPSSQQWTVPIGGGVGKIFHFGKLPVNTQISAYYNVVKPDFGPNWQIRAQVQLMFPK